VGVCVARAPLSVVPATREIAVPARFILKRFRITGVRYVAGPSRAGRGADPDFRIPPSGRQINIQNGNK